MQQIFFITDVCVDVVTIRCVVVKFGQVVLQTVHFSQLCSP